MLKLSTYISLIITMYGFQINSWAQSFLNANEIKQLVQEHIQHSLFLPQDAEVEITVKSLDSRLKVKACDRNALELLLPQNNNTYQLKTVGLKCHKPQKWTIFSPIDIKISSPVVISAKPIPKGKIIEASDLIIQKRNITNLTQGFYTKPKNLIGLISNRSIAMGEPLFLRQLKQPMVIKKGQQVQIIANNSRVNVRMEGIALMPGQIGERIKVKNLSSEKVIEGMVKHEQAVYVDI